jgi:hypothetical protein
MNALLNHWKLFATFVVIGLFAAVGLRAAGSAPGDSSKHTESETRQAAPKPRPDSTKDTATAPKSESGDLLIDLGNDACPVMGGEVDGKTYGEWNHIRVGYCCPGCDRKFQKDPEGALDKFDIEWREAAKAVQGYMAATGDHKQHKLAAIRKRWTVVRKPSGG